MSTTVRLGDVVRVKGEKREGRVISIEPDGVTVVYPKFDEDGIPYGPGEKITLPADRFERPRVVKGDVALHPETGVEGLVTYVRGDYATLRPRDGGRPLDVMRDSLVRVNHYSSEGLDG